MGGRQHKKPKPHKAHKSVAAKPPVPPTEQPTAPDPSDHGEETMQNVKWFHKPDAGISLLILTAILAVIYIGQLKAMQNSVKLTERALQLDKRAWINPVLQWQPSTVEGQPVIGTVIISNSGTTPAKNVHVAAIIKNVPNGPDPTFDDPLPRMTTQTTALMFPGEGQPLKVQWYRYNIVGVMTVPGMAIISHDESSQLSDGKSFFIFYGRVTFTDIFGMDHWVRFCDWKGFTHTVYAMKCTTYNDIDPEPKQ